MYKFERLAFIYSELLKKKKTTVNELSDLMSVSKETIRTDLNLLEKKQLVKRFHGGAVLNIEFRFDSSPFPSDSIYQISGLLGDALFNPERNERGVNMQAGKVCILGSFNVDIVSTLERFPLKGETVIAEHCNIGPGGKGANQALAASNSNCSVYFMTKVGNDRFKDFAENHLKKSGIKSFSLLTSDSHATGSATIFVSRKEKDNLIAIYPGANRTFSDEEVLLILPQLDKSTVFLSQCEINFTALRYAIDMAKRQHAYVILNPAPYTAFVLDLLGDVDLLTPNQSEASEICGFPVTDLQSAAEAIKIIRLRGANEVLITLGGDGVIFSQGKNIIHIPPFKSVVNDTTGAGDAFNGALAAKISNGEDMIKAVIFASAFASLAIEKVGAGSMPQEKQALDRIRSQDFIRPVYLTTESNAR